MWCGFPDKKPFIPKNSRKITFTAVTKYCGLWDSNPHTSRHKNLNLTCLPIPSKPHHDQIMLIVRSVFRFTIVPYNLTKVTTLLQSVHGTPILTYFDSDSGSRISFTGLECFCQIPVTGCHLAGTKQIVDSLAMTRDSSSYIRGSALLFI